MASLTGQKIKDTYQSLLKTEDNGLITNAFKGITDGSGSSTGLYLRSDGVYVSGSLILSGSLLYSGSTINITVNSSSYASTASYALNGESTDTGSFLVTASVASNTITFTKGDNTTFNVTVDTGSSAVSIVTSSFATTGSNTFVGEQTISGSIQISGSIIPTVDGISTTSSFSLGSATNAWKDIFVSNGTINFLDGAGNIQAALSSTPEGLTISGSLIVGEIVAPSGSTGAYTGSLEGTASFATTSSYYNEIDPIFTSLSSSLATTGSNNFNGNQVITGSLTQGSGGSSSGLYSHAEGTNNIASGESSHAEGLATQASGDYSHTEGFTTQASGESSHAEGYNTQALGIYSHAEGVSARSIGEGSHAEGFNTRAVGDYSHAEGRATISSGSYQHATGWYNLQNNTGSYFIVGIGSQDNLRKDGFTVDVDANGSGSIMIPNNLDAPSVAKTGSMYVDPANSKLWVYTGNGGNSGWRNTAFDSLITASVAASTITFTKGDNTTFDIVVAQSGSIESSSYAVYAASAGTASYVELAQTASYVLNAVSASHSTTASYVQSAQTASYYAMPLACYAWNSGYGNLSNNTDNNVKWDTEVFNTRSDIFELSGSGTTDARIYIKQPGYYEFISQVHIYDLTGNMDLLIKLTSGSDTGALGLVSLLNDNKFAENSADQTTNGNIIVNVASAGYYSVAINPSANTPFPSNTDNTPTRLFIKKLA